MLLKTLIESAMAHATLGQGDPDTLPLRKFTFEADAIVDICIHALSHEIATNPALRARMMKQYNVALSTDGFGHQYGLPSDEVMIEFIHEGAVRDADTGAPNGLGNILHRKLHETDFRNYLAPNYGYYWCGADTSGSVVIRVKAPGASDFSSMIGPLTLIVPHTPIKSNLNTEVPNEVSDRLIELMAIRVRGFIAGEQPAVA